MKIILGLARMDNTAYNTEGLEFNDSERLTSLDILHIYIQIYIRIYTSLLGVLTSYCSEDIQASSAADTNLTDASRYARRFTQ